MLECRSALTTHDLHVVQSQPLPAPAEILNQLPLSEPAALAVSQGRDRVRHILNGEDERLLVIVGPCSIHDLRAARDYGERLAAVREQVKDALEVVMRVYFEKPRTTIGWKGLINDPHLNGSFDIATGLRLARQLLLDVAEMGLPAATELLDPITPQYLADLITWTAIGARTTESQTHREMASGLSMPVGFKNGTDGSVDVAINAMVSARQPHCFLGVNPEGRVSIIQTTGNPDGHLVLRGGKLGPNYDVAHVTAIAQRLQDRHVPARLMIDCSHDNSGQDYTQQPHVLRDVAQQIAAGSGAIVGVMLESHLTDGKQPFPKTPEAKEQLIYGRSITDGCLDFATTTQLLHHLAAAVRQGRSGL